MIILRTAAHLTPMGRISSGQRSTSLLAQNLYSICSSWKNEL